jgi:hypothetical protein
MSKSMHLLFACVSAFLVTACLSDEPLESSLGETADEVGLPVPTDELDDHAPPAETPPDNAAELHWVTEDGAELPADAGEPDDAAARHPGPGAVWRACGISDKNTKVVRKFDRAASRFPAPHFGAGVASLGCGSKAWGYRHILDRHLSQWEFIASFDRVNWRTAADWGMWNALKHPGKTTYRASNNTYSYETTIYLKNKNTGQIVKKATVVAVVAHVTKNIITSYPTAVKNF